jgi:hypothetical protein
MELHTDSKVGRHVHARGSLIWVQGKFLVLESRVAQYESTLFIFLPRFQKRRQQGRLAPASPLHRHVQCNLIPNKLPFFVAERRKAAHCSTLRPTTPAHATARRAPAASARRHHLRTPPPLKPPLTSSAECNSPRARSNRPGTSTGL